jgi:hypothetical protein
MSRRQTSAACDTFATTGPAAAGGAGLRPEEAALLAMLRASAGRLAKAA